MNLLKSHGWRQAGHLRKQICNFDCDAETANLQCLKVSCEVTLLHYLTTFTWLDHNSSPQYLTWLHYSTAVLKEASLLHFITWLFTLLHYWTTLLHFSAWQITLLHCLATLCHFMRCVPYAHYLTWLQYCTTARSDRDRKASFRRLHPRSLGGTYRWKKTPGFRVFAIYFVLKKYVCGRHVGQLLRSYYMARGTSQLHNTVVLRHQRAQGWRLK